MKLIRQGLERGMFMTFGEKVRSLRKEKKLYTEDLQFIGDLVREYIDIYQLPSYCNYLIKAYREVAKKN